MSIFGIQAESIVNTLWDALRPEKPGYEMRLNPETNIQEITQLGLMVALDLRLSHYALSCDEYHRSALVRFVLTANTSVFFHASPDFDRVEKIEASAWENSSNHDSCWRSDGMRPLSELYFRLCEEMNAEITEHGFSPLAPKEFSQFCTLGALGSKPWEFVTVSHRKIPGEYHKRELLSLERLSSGDHR